MKTIKLSIRRSSFLLILTTAAFSMIVLSSTWIYSDIAKSNKEIAKLRKEQENQQQSIIKKEVDDIIDLINYNIKYNTSDSLSTIQNNILDYVSSLRLDHGGYAFINTYQGQALVFDGVKIIGVKDIRNITDPNGIRLFDVEMKHIKNVDGGFFQYKFKRLDTFEPVPKISYVRGFDEWGWIIGTGIYLDEYDNIILSENNKNEYGLYKTLLNISIVFLVSMIVLIILSYYFSKAIKKEFSVFLSFFKNHINDGEIINTNTFKITEFRNLASETNIVIEKNKTFVNELIQKKNKALQYIDYANIILVALDKNGVVTMINKKGWETLEYDRTYIVGKDWFSNFVPKNDRTKLFNKFAIFISSGKSTHFNNDNHILTKLGIQKLISWNNTLIKDKNGDSTGLICSGLDITEVRKVETSYYESEQKYKLLFEKSSDATMLIDSNNTFVDCNESALNMFKIKSKSGLIGKHPAQLSPIKQSNGELSLLKASEYIDTARRKGYVRFEWLHITKDNIEFHCDTALTTIPVGGVDYLYVVLRDISEKKKQASELIVAKEKAEQSDKIKGSFLHNMQHEIRTPLNAIIGFTQLLQLQNTDKDEETESYYNAIISSGNQLTKIIDDIISYSQLRAGHIIINEKSVEISNLVCDVFKQQYFLHQKKNLIFNISPDLLATNTILTIDSEKMMLILGHLLDNAFKFTESGSIELGYKINNDGIILHVSDTGIGIHTNHYDSIFEMFNRISLQDNQKLYGGNGLGLSISSEILSHIGGKIWVESNVDQGSKFSFFMPTNKAKNKNADPIQPISPSTITVVTNNNDTYNNISEIYKDLEISTVHLLSGEEAIKYCQGNFKTELMIIDINLISMNAVTLSKALKAFNKRLPMVIAIPKISNPNITKEDALIAGCSNFFYLDENKNVIINKTAYLISKYR